MVFCNSVIPSCNFSSVIVTILILIDGFLQWDSDGLKNGQKQGHNPYFNRWFSAILSSVYKMKYDNEVTILILIDGFLQFL